MVWSVSDRLVNTHHPWATHLWDQLSKKSYCGVSKPGMLWVEDSPEPDILVTCAGCARTQCANCGMPERRHAYSTKCLYSPGNFKPCG